MDEAILAEIVRLIREVVRRPDLPLRPASFLADAPGMDSLRVLECLALAERRFGREVSPAALENLTTVGDLVAAIERAPPAGDGAA